MLFERLEHLKDLTIIYIYLSFHSLNTYKKYVSSICRVFTGNYGKVMGNNTTIYEVI